MNFGQPLGSLAYQFAGIRHAQRPLGADELRQVDAIHVFHGQVGQPVKFTRVAGVDHVDVVHTARGLHLALEALQPPLVANLLGGQELQGERLL